MTRAVVDLDDEHPDLDDVPPPPHDVCERWQPDENLIDHARLARLSVTALSGPDRAWVVAGLTAAGWTADAIAHQLRCSLRLVKQIRAEPMTIVAAYALRVRDQAHADAARARDAERRHAHALAGLRGELARMTNQRNQLIERRQAVRSRA